MIRRPRQGRQTGSHELFFGNREFRRSSGWPVSLSRPVNEARSSEPAACFIAFANKRSGHHTRSCTAGAAEMTWHCSFNQGR